MIRLVIVRVLLFAAWALVGAVASYGLLYLLTPYGLVILGTCVFAGLALPEAGGRRWPECLGLAAGPGVLLLYVASLNSDPAAAAAGAAIVAVASVAYLLAGRALCARPRRDRRAAAG
jgi:hypothetical protein